MTSYPATSEIDATTVRIDLSAKSFVIVRRGAVKITADEFHSLLALCPSEHGKVVLFGKTFDIPRFQRLYGAASYKFSGVTVEPNPVEHPVLQRLLDYVGELEGVAASDVNPFNGMLVNWYLTGAHHIGPHADDEGDLVAGAPIYSFSFGATRTFRFHPIKGGPRLVDIDLEDGTMVAMCGACQREFKHSVPKSAVCKDPRINMTIRAFVVD